MGMVGRIKLQIRRYTVLELEGRIRHWKRTGIHRRNLRTCSPSRGWQLDLRRYKKACNAIKAAGYATDPEYANKLIEIIEQYKLTEFDGKTESQENQGAGAAGADAGKYYRVQAGAYRRKEGANLMAEQIKKTGHTDVFVRLLNGLYKVQVGAYTEKKNAEATVKRLKAAGIVCFITYA